MASFLGLITVLIFEYIRPSTWVPALGPVGTVIALSAFTLSFLARTENSNIDILNNRNGKLFLFYLGLIVLSVLTADVTMFAYNRFKEVFGYFLVFFMIAKLATDTKKISLLFALMVFMHVLLLALNPKIILNPETRHYVQNAGFLGDGNDLAWSLCIAFPMAIFLLQEARSFIMRILCFGGVGILLIGIIGTQSRGATLALGAVLLNQWYHSRNRWLGVVAVAAAIGVVLAFAPPAYFQRMETISDYENESSAAFRLQIWQSAIRMANDHPIMGVGAGHFSVNFGTKYRPPGASPTSLPWQNAHSIYFMTLGELGYTGLVFLLAFILTNWYAMRRLFRDADRLPSPQRDTQQRLLVAINSSLLGFAVAGAFLSGIYYPHIYVVAGLLTAVVLQYQRTVAQLPARVSALSSEVQRQT